MPAMFWNAEWRTGEPGIDGHHQDLLDHLERLTLSFVDLRPRPEVEGTLLFLDRYQDAHFREEEAFMARLAYPGLDQHRTCHQELRRQLQSQLREGHASPIDWMNFLTRTHLTHITREDARLAAFLREGRRSGATAAFT